MADYESRRTEEGFRRLITFADAVVAIALTLLVLPLADIPREISDDTTVGDVLSEYLPEIISFFVSFIVIWVLWRNHHRIMEHFRTYDRVLFELHFVWLLTIVVLPFVTAMLDNEHIERANAVYMGVLAVSILSLISMTAWGARRRELLEPGDDIELWLRRRSGAVTFLLLVVAMVIAIIYPETDSWPLLLLVLSGPLEKLLARLRGRRAESSPG
ncbi:TMEM175 family protein [Gordonia sp. SL306]|uniref:TMEM175 family protein n=1 Tax=Gordonia sp. SL306 TaxID=2995145 RepID=UPI00226DA988|nr:TMEM175 family protein [Gordonia sp. SL306]WAC54076.1 TMEM175 family protein [Gordonia sp. SL306]